MRCSVIRNAPGRFILLFALSHIVGDGHTYYNVLGQLNLADPSGQCAAHAAPSRRCRCLSRPKPRPRPRCPATVVYP